MPFTGHKKVPLKIRIRFFCSEPATEVTNWIKAPFCFL